MEVTRVDYLGWEKCYQVSNQLIDLIVPSSFGIRILHLGFHNDCNQFAVIPPASGNKQTWHIYGGHRLWYAPEQKALAYQPDNHPVQVEVHDEGIRVTQPVEALTGLKKQIDFSLHPSQPRAQVVHRLENAGDRPVTVAPWAISSMAPGSWGILPLSHRSTLPDQLVPQDGISLWPYTDMSDPRWAWMEKYVMLKHDSQNPNPQKAGAAGRSGWIGSFNEGCLFIKTYSYHCGQSYPDGGCSAEMYVNQQLLEIETLGPLVELRPGERVEHVESWFLFEDIPDIAKEEHIDKNLLPVIRFVIEESS